MLRTNSSRSPVRSAGIFVHESHLNVNRRWRAILHLCGAPLMILSANCNASAQVRSEAAAPAQLTIDATQIVSPVSPMLYGPMTEEINHSYEGGLRRDGAEPYLLLQLGGSDALGSCATCQTRPYSGQLRLALP